VASSGTQTTPEQYLAALPTDRREPLIRIRDSILRNLPRGYAEGSPTHDHLRMTPMGGVD
jgi:hypothetical protein